MKALTCSDHQPPNVYQTQTVFPANTGHSPQMLAFGSSLVIFWETKNVQEMSHFNTLA